MKTVAVIQARMGSTRFPGKVMKHLVGQPIIDHVIRRVSSASTVSHVVVATTDLQVDDDLASYVTRRHGIAVIRGSDTDVLGRFATAVRKLSLENCRVVRITADCPVVSPRVIDSVVSLYRRCTLVDYASNVHPATWPDGFDVEVMCGSAILQAEAQAVLPSEREHVTPWIWKRCQTANLGNPDGDMSSVRLTVDHEDDIDFLEKLSYECDITQDMTCRQIQAAVAKLQDTRAHVRNEGYMLSLQAE